MTKLKLGPLADDKPVRITTELTVAAHRDLVAYQAGKFALIDVLDAQTALAAARRALVDAELAHARSAAALDRASATQEILP